MVKPSFVKQFISEVTPAQIGACTKILDCQTHTNFYFVQSERDDLVEYKVVYSHSKGFQCSCEAGQRGFANCKHGFCKHVKWAVACAEEEKAALAELSRKQEQVKSALDRQIEECVASGRPAWLMTGLPRTVRGNTVYPTGYRA